MSDAAVAEADALDANEITAVELDEEIEIALETKENLLVEGMPGIGKTEIPAQIAKRRKIGFKRLVGPQYEEVDLRGIPEVNERKRTVFYPTEELPHADVDGEEGILLLDEWPSAKPSVQIIGHQLLDSRKLGQLYELPPGWIVIMTGNRSDDAAYVHEVPSTIITRSARYTLIPEYGNWKRWAYDTGNVIPEIVSFIDKNPQEFIVFEPDKPAINFALPRTWHKLSDYVRARTKRGQKPALSAIVARVGQSAGAKFHGWFDVLALMPDVDGVLAGTEKKVPRRIDVQYCVVSSLIAKLTSAKGDKTIVQKAKNALGYLNALTSDLVISFLNDIMVTKFWKDNKKGLIKTQEFATLTKNHARNITGAGLEE